MLLRSRLLVSTLFALCSVVLCSFRADARTMFLDNPMRLPFSGFASSLALVGDVDGDGVADFLVGAYNHRWDKNDRQGRAFVFSGATGKLLFTIDNPSPQVEAAFGFSVAAAGDVNKDGTPDLLIGALGQEGRGKAFLFNGKDGKLLYALQAPKLQKGAGFGWAVVSLGDLTNDGIPDIAVGAFAQEDIGYVYLFNGSDGKLLRTIAPPAGSLAFGWSLSAAGDVNKDGIPDIIVGAPYTTVGENTVQGRVYVFSGKDDSLLLTLDTPQPTAGGVFGWCMTAVGDQDKDGVPDFLVGAPYQDVNKVISQGAAYVFSGATGKLLFSLKDPLPRPYSVFGYSVAAGPDVNQDGVPELLVGAPYQSVDQFHIQGEVFLFNGRDGRHLTTFDDPYPHQGSSFGYTVVSPGDINGDKIPDFAFGAAGQGIMDKPAVGRVMVFLSQQ
jgi:FG-GAP repeat/FG-GAP-like repeat